MQQVRAQSPCGILILTGRAHVSDRVMGLELGARLRAETVRTAQTLVARVRSIVPPPGKAAKLSARQIAEFSGWRFQPGQQTA